MNDKYREQFLRHHGILGMKWGVRKSKSRVKSSNSSKKSSGEVDNKRRRMSNRELQARIKRLQLEKQYKDLTAVPKKTTSDKIETLIKYANYANQLTGSAQKIHENILKIAAQEAGRRS